MVPSACTCHRSEAPPDDRLRETTHHPNRHCERSDAIHQAARRKLQASKKAGLVRGACHRARIRSTRQLNDGKTLPYVPAARYVWALPETSALKTEGVGNAGRPMHPQVE
jgi:hypothetical protein